MYQSKVYFLIEFLWIAFIPGSQSQTNEDVQKFVMILRSNLDNTLPSLLQNISTLYQPLGLKNEEAAEIYLNTMDAAKLLSSTGPSNAVSEKTGISVIKDVEDFINFVVKFIVNGLVFGGEALLTPVIVLLQVLLSIVAILLNIILWVVRALLASLLTDLGAGGLGYALSSILGAIQNAVDKILKDVEELLGHLTILK